jgi:hypothetical protein
VSVGTELEVESTVDRQRETSPAADDEERFAYRISGPKVQRQRAETETGRDERQICHKHGGSENEMQCDPPDREPAGWLQPKQAGLRECA